MVTLADSRVLFVVGMHRAGTSAVTKQLVLGGGTVPDDLIPAAADNPEGFFESLAVADINEKVLEYFGSSWRDPAALPDDWQKQIGSSDIPGKILQLLEANLQPRKTLVLKDPRLCRTLSLWIASCGQLEADCSVLAVSRDPVAVARSLWTRNHIPSGHCLQLWCRYYLDLGRSLAGRRHGMIRFEEFCENASILQGQLLPMEGIQLDSPTVPSAIVTAMINNGGAMPVTASERHLHRFYRRELGHGGLSEFMLRYYYRLLGGDQAAMERRHYGAVAMILDQVIKERDELLATVSRDD
jgi:hypothetical protein